jgi:hypothetical protein
MINNSTSINVSNEEPALTSNHYIQNRPPHLPIEIAIESPVLGENITWLMVIRIPIIPSWQIDLQGQYRYKQTIKSIYQMTTSTQTYHVHKLLNT